MGNLVKQSVTEVTFMDSASTEDDIRCITLRIDSEGAGRFLVLKNEREGSEMYFSTINDLRLIYETAKAMWRQGDLFAPGDDDNDFKNARRPVVSWANEGMFMDLEVEETTRKLKEAWAVIEQARKERGE